MLFPPRVYDNGGAQLKCFGDWPFMLDRVELSGALPRFPLLEWSYCEPSIHVGVGRLAGSGINDRARSHYRRFPGSKPPRMGR